MFRLLFLAALALAMPAFASDGVLEISQTCAVQTGCFAGDAAGFPVTVSTSGSYRLTSNLTVPDTTTSGISVTTNHVSIDLGGFAIQGPVVCSGSPPVTTVTCNANSGSGSGVVSAQIGVSVSNGSVRGMGNLGVFVGPQATVTNLRVYSNRLDGINVGAASVVSGNAAYLNGQDGIQAGDAGLISGNSLYRNGADGINTGAGSTVLGNTAMSNGQDGIEADRAIVQSNTVVLNVGYGLNIVSAQGGYRENMISGNSAGIANNGIDMGGNLCDGSTTCP